MQVVLAATASLPKWEIRTSHGKSVLTSSDVVKVSIECLKWSIGDC